MYTSSCDGVGPSRGTSFSPGYGAGNSTPSYSTDSLSQMGDYVDRLCGLKKDDRGSDYGDAQPQTLSAPGACGPVHDTERGQPPAAPDAPGSDGRQYWEFAPNDPNAGTPENRDKVDAFGYVYAFDPTFARYENCGTTSGYGDLQAYSDEEYCRINKLDQQKPVNGGVTGDGNKPASETPVSTTSVTETPVSAAPVTEAPVSAAPVTEAPVSAAPVTEAPVSAAPATEAPVSAAPVTEAPVSSTPASDTGTGSDALSPDAQIQTPVAPFTAGSEAHTYKEFAPGDPNAGSPEHRDMVDELGNVFVWDPIFARYEACGKDDGKGGLIAYSDEEYCRINKLDEQTPVDGTANKGVDTPSSDTPASSAPVSAAPTPPTPTSSAPASPTPASGTPVSNSGSAQGTQNQEPVAPFTAGSEAHTYKEFAPGDPNAGPPEHRDMVDELGNVYVWDPIFGRYEACGKDDGKGGLIAYSDEEYCRINKLDQQTPVGSAASDAGNSGTDNSGASAAGTPGAGLSGAGDVPYQNPRNVQGDNEAPYKNPRGSRGGAGAKYQNPRGTHHEARYHNPRGSNPGSRPTSAGTNGDASPTGGTPQYHNPRSSHPGFKEAGPTGSMPSTAGPAPYQNPRKSHPGSEPTLVGLNGNTLSTGGVPQYHNPRSSHPGTEPKSVMPVTSLSTPVTLGVDDVEPMDIQPIPETQLTTETHSDT